MKMSTNNRQPTSSNGSDKSQENETRSDLDDIENLLTVHVMCKSSKLIDGESNKTNDENEQNSKQEIDRLSQPEHIDKIETKLTNNRDKRRRNSNDHNTNSIQINKKYKNDYNKIGKFKNTSNKLKVYSSARHSSSYLKVKSQEALGLNDLNTENNFKYKTNEKIKLKSSVNNNVNNTCRLCGKNIKISNYLDGNNIFNCPVSKINYCEKINIHLNIKLQEDDGLSHYICHDCSDQVVRWCKFYDQCTIYQKQINKQCFNNSIMKSPKSDNMVDEIKKEIKVEDNIEKMLREMHGIESDAELSENDANKISNCNNDINKSRNSIVNDLGDTNDELDETGVDNIDENDFEIEYLEEEQELIDHVLKYQKNSRKGVVKKAETVKNRKIICTDRKLSEDELRSLMEKTGYNQLSTVTVIKTPSDGVVAADVDKRYTQFKEHLTRAKQLSSKQETVDQEQYDLLAKSYSHHILDHIKTETEMFFRCPNCRIYLPSNELPRHIQNESGKLSALCDFCKILFPYNTTLNKSLVHKHIELHNNNKQSNHPDVITNICQLLESSPEAELPSQSIVKEDDNESEFISTKNSPKKIISKSRYRCNQCPARFPIAQQIREHFKLHKNESVTCRHCTMKFPNRFSLNNHEKVTHSNDIRKKFICEYCNLEFDDEKTYDIHMKAEENLNPSEFVCPHCSSVFTNRNLLMEHAKTHYEETFICDICGIGCISSDELKLHQNNIHCYNTLSCLHCGYKTFTKIGLRNHIRNSHPEISVTNNLPHMCDHCTESFQSFNKLKEHVRNTHQIQRSYQCPLCDWSFNHQINLLKHFEVHLDKGHTICKVCQLPFEYNGVRLQIDDVLAHKQTHTEEENFVYQRPYSPSVSRMTPWRDIKNHSGNTISSSSTQPRMFCRDCGVACSTPLQLRKHQKTHKPFYCNMCQTVSNNEQTFLLHMEQHADRKYVCKTCGKRFMTRTAINLHYRTHAHSPKFSCVICSRRFRIATDCKRHERTCRETHGLPKLEIEISSNRQRIQQNTEDNNFMELVGDENITYEYAEQDSNTDVYNQELNAENADDEESTSYYVVQEENSDETIEIDESQLAEFQEWQRIATTPTQTIKNEVVSADSNKSQDGEGDNESSNIAVPVYYSMEEVPGSNKKQFRFVPQYVAENENEIDTNNILQENQIIADNTQSAVILNTADASLQEVDNPNENVVYVDPSNNIVYNLQNNINLQTDIVFDGDADDSNNTQEYTTNVDSDISFVFRNSHEQNSIEKDDGDVTIYLKDGQVVSTNETLEQMSVSNSIINN